MSESKVLGKFDEFEIDLSYKQKQKVKDGRTAEVLNEHLENADKVIRFQKWSILIGLILIILCMYFIFSKPDVHSSLVALLSGLGGASLFGGICQLKFFNSYRKNVRSLKQELA